MRSRPGAVLLIPAILALVGPPARAADRCLEGAAAAGDRTQIRALRSAIATGCVCAPSRSHGRYVACASTVLRRAIKDGSLRRPCRGAVLLDAKRSTCGDPLAAETTGPTSTRRRVPCLETRAGAVSCVVRSARRCVSDAKVTRTVCGAPSWPYTHCLDAADTNGDLRIAAPWDSGHCAIAQETVDIPSTATPARTPGTPGVAVTNQKLMTQFGGTDFTLNRARYTRYHFAGSGRSPAAILILVPGFEGGAGGFKILAENLLSRALADHGRTIEVWAYDRRTDQLEDRLGLDVAEEMGDPAVALDWLYGSELGLPLSAALPRRAVFYDTQGDIPFLADWTSLVFSRDIDAVVDVARAVTANVFLGGHSAGTGFTARYAATDFNLSGVGAPEPGYSKLRGLVLIDGPGGSALGPPPTEEELDRIEARFDGGLFAAVRDKASRCVDGSACTVDANCAATPRPRCTPTTTAYSAGFGGLLNARVLAVAEPVALQGVEDPDHGPLLLQVDQGGIAGNNVLAKVPDLVGLKVLLPPSTVEGAIGSFLDEDSLAAGIASFLAASVGAPGPVVDGLHTWLDITESASFPPCPSPTCVTPDNGPPPTTLPASAWGQEREVTRMDRMIEGFFAGHTNFTDWYYASSGLGVTMPIDLDSTALSVGRGRRDIENLTQAGQIDIPVIGFGASNGYVVVPGGYLPFAQSIGPCTAPSCDGTPRVLDAAAPSPAFPTFGDVGGGYEVHISVGYSHVDMITAEDGPTNQEIGPLSDFIARNVR